MQNAVNSFPKPSAQTRSGPTPLFATADDLDGFIRWARSDPRAAASALADSLDRRRTHYEGSDLARTLDSWAFDPDADGLDALAWYAARPHQDPTIGLGLAAIMAGAQALTRSHAPHSA
jgi:hypothetical protein